MFEVTNMTDIKNFISTYLSNKLFKSKSMLWAFKLNWPCPWFWEYCGDGRELGWEAILPCPNVATIPPWLYDGLTCCGALIELGDILWGDINSGSELDPKGLCDPLGEPPRPENQTTFSVKGKIWNTMEIYRFYCLQRESIYEYNGHQFQYLYIQELILHLWLQTCVICTQSQ